VLKASLKSARLVGSILSLAMVYFSGLFSAQAEVLVNDSRSWRRAQLVNAGQQVWSFQSSYQKTSDRFGTSGQVEPLGAKYARAVTWGQLLKTEGSAQGRADMESYMRSRGAKPNDIAATSTYQLEREDVGFSIDWAYGMTRNWMIGFQVPLTLRRTKVSSRVEMTPVLAQGVGQQGQKSILSLDNNQVRDKVKALAEEELSNSGYDNIPDQNQSWQWGDASLLSQFYLANAYRWNWALQQMVRFPTSQNPSVSDYLQATGDDGQVDLGLTSLMDYRMRKWTLGARLGYVAQLPDSAKMRVTDGESAAIDPKVHRDLGDWVWGALDADVRLTRRWGMDFEYAFLAKSRDKYKGAMISSSRNTDQEVHQTRLGLLYNIGTSTSRRGVEKRWVASLGYTQPWIGKNSADAGKAAVELISYF
jgi:hypothetical protein